MKKLLILLFALISFTGYAQTATFGGIGLRVNDTTTYQTNAATLHGLGYYDIYFNNQATNDHWDVWNGSSYDHIFSFASGASGNFWKTDGNTTVTQDIIIDGSSAGKNIEMYFDSFVMSTATSGFGFDAAGADFTGDTGYTRLRSENGADDVLIETTPTNLKLDTDQDMTWIVGDDLIINSSSGTTGQVIGNVNGTPQWETPSGGGGVSGLTTNRVPYAASSTSLADNANFIVRRSSAIQGNNGFGVMGQVVIGGTYNTNRNNDYSSAGKHSYGLEIINNQTPFETDSLSSGQLSLTGYGGAAAGNTSFHARAARGTQAAPTKLLSGDRIGGMGFRGYTDAGEFSTSSAAILVYTEQDFVSQSTLGSQMQFEVTTNSVPGRIIAQTIDNTGAVGFLNSIAAGTTITAGTNITSTAGSIIAAADADINGVVDIDGTSGQVALTIGTPTNGFGISKAYGIFDNQTNDGFSIGSESGSNLRGSNTDRIGRIKFSQRAANSTTYFAGLQGQSTSTLNLLQYGIAATPTNSATEHRFYTGATLTTVAGTEQWRISQNGNLSNTAATGTGYLNLKASTTAANTGQIRLAEGSALTTPEDGNINYVSNNLQFTETSTVYTLAKTLTATATLNFDLTAVNSQDLTITVTGAATGDVVAIALDAASVPADITYFGWVSATNTVTVRCSRVGGGGAVDPASGTFRASVIHY